MNETPLALVKAHVGEVFVFTGALPLDGTVPSGSESATYVQMARRHGKSKSAFARATYEVVTRHFSIGRLVSGAQLPVCASDAPARN